jgi:hypothetical protein
VIAVAAVAALAIGLGLGQFWLAREGENASARPQELVSVTTALSPTAHAFGDPVQARADVLVDTREIGLDSVVLQPSFEPYEAVGPPQVTREQFGDLGRVRYTYRLVCLEEGCDTAEGRGVSNFPGGRLRYRFRDRPGNAFESFDWPLLEVSSRVASSDVEEIRWRSDATSLVPASYRVGPLAAALVLLAAAIGCAAAAVLIARRLWWPKRVADVDEGDAAETRSHLEQAFDVALHSADGDRVPERRRALERVARELGAAGRTELAGEARALAWSPAPSTSAQIASLAGRAGVRTAAGGSA